ncbi:MAG: RNA 2',3'-cyclic phosphodiesterase [Sporocytophaga sp.]|uniref:RNA 2',3'-cyclic phosphodiesterase n=1 Tax=Sporocytophaga sp. TaxID=2231183 RepID=UPI001B2376E9|nr:RNA 2',3'-cyclic phosphodiesterase [Sporocytophaga sp.]MBO9698816.1 RNA 2',3'-cyclic phosphodiesterase [Sporocytophaga sp.]
MSEHRLFIALPLPDPIKDLLSEFQANIQTDIKWIPRDNLHITLAFIGATPTERISGINSVLQKISESTTNFSLETQTIKVVKSASGMIWVTFQANNSFNDLALAIREKLNLSEKRKPLPHINLARLKHGYLENPLGETKFEVVTIPFAKMELWESELTHSGPQYKVISSFFLN